MLEIEPRFARHGIVLRQSAAPYEQLGVLNPACARLRDGRLQLYPRMVAAGNISRIGSFAGHEEPDGTMVFEQRGFALEPEAPYELRDQPGGYGCEDPRITFVPVIDTYVMTYVAFGQRGPEVALAISDDGLRWERVGLLYLRGGQERFADKDAAFFPEPIRSPSGTLCLALYHRPTLDISVREGESAVTALKALPPERRESISVAYIALDAVKVIYARYASRARRASCGCRRPSGVKLRLVPGPTRARARGMALRDSWRRRIGGSQRWISAAIQRGPDRP